MVEKILILWRGASEQRNSHLRENERGGWGGNDLKRKNQHKRGDWGPNFGLYLTKASKKWRDGGFAEGGKREKVNPD